MAEITPFAISRLLSDLVGKQVDVSLNLKPLPSKLKQLYGIYHQVPSNKAIVVKADLPLLASLAAELIGLPMDTAIERALETPINEGVRDAIHEVLNITSTVLSVDARVVFDKMVFDPVFCDGESADVLRAPDLKSNFNIAVGGKSPGLFTVLTRF